MNDTITPIAGLAVGQRVMYVGGGVESNDSLVGKFGKIIENDGTITLPWRVEWENAQYLRWWCESVQLVPVPFEGDTVVARIVTGEERYDGRRCTVTAVEHNRTTTTNVLMRGEFADIQKPDDTISLVFQDWERVVDGSTLTTSSEDGRIAVLERELARANERVEELRDRASKWERDFGRTWTRFGNEAVQRRWCSEYEEVKDDLQEQMEIATIPDRPKERVRKTRRVQAVTYIDISYYEDEDESSDDPDEWFTDATGDEPMGIEEVKRRLRDEYARMGDFDEYDYDPE